MERVTPLFDKQNSIAEINKIKIGGIEQGVLIRGENIENPILLILHGGPGAPHVGYTRHYQTLLEKEFIVVNWDQRGSGMSYYKDIPITQMTIEQFISDTMDIIKYLKKRFNKAKVVLLGYSWGSILGLEIINRYPQDIAMYFGMSQAINSKENTVQVRKLIAQKTASNEIPYDNMQLEQMAFSLGGMHTDLKLADKLINICASSGEYTTYDCSILSECMVFSRKCLQKCLENIDFDKRITKLEVPVCLLEGRNDMILSPYLAQTYFESIQAPKKEFVWFENSAHDIMFAENELWQKTIIDKYKTFAK